MKEPGPRQPEPLRFSVVIPTFNRAHTIERPLNSLLSQTYEDFEILVIDDGSTDETKDVVRKSGSERIQYHWQSNRGRCAARNKGAELSRGEFVAFVDSDDEVHPSWLQRFAETLTPDTGIVCCGWAVRRASAEQAETPSDTRLPAPMGTLYYNFPGPYLSGSFAIRKEVFLAAGGYCTELSVGENTDLAHRVLAVCTKLGLMVKVVPEPLLIIHFNRPEGYRNILAHLQTAEHMLLHYGKRYRVHAPWGFANYCAIAGVNATRLSLHRKALRYFLLAVMARPLSGKHLARLLLAFVPPLARRVWQERGNFESAVL